MEKEIVYTASKVNYGTGPFRSFKYICNTLDELKKAIVKHELNPYGASDRYTEKDYTEELFEKWSKDKRYELYEIHLHQDEQIIFTEHVDETETSDFYFKSDFYIKLKVLPNILSTVKPIGA